MSRCLRRTIGILFGITLLAAGFLQFALPYYPESKAAIAAMQGSATVQVTTDRWLVFQPVTESEEVPQTGFIFYPGARVSPRSYAPLADDLAAAGFLVAIVPMPLHLAVLGIHRARDVQDAFPAIQHWVIGGHSLGGAMAARYARENPDIAGLVLWAAYPGRNDDLGAWSGAVLSISATEDELADSAKIQASTPLLPPHTTFVVIEGGNHAQFGAYGVQRRDGEATITPQKQQYHVVQHTASLLRKVSMPR